jgi:hypothetical protein
MAQLSVITGSAPAAGGADAVQATIAAAVSNGTMVPSLKFSPRPENVIPQGFLNIWNSFLSYDKSYRM